MSSPLRLAVIGAAGRIASDWIATAERCPSTELVALVDPEVQRIPGSGDARTFSSLGELLDEASADFDAAVVAVPPHLHEDSATKLMAAGKPVLCEKPLAPTIAAAERMLAASDLHGPPIVLASKFRFTAPVRSAIEWIRGGDLGTPVAYENVFSARVPMPGRWNADPAVSGGGVLADNGPHAADLARALCGPIRAVAASAPRPSQDVAVEDSIRMLLEFEHGAVGSVDLSWSLDAARDTLAIIRGTEGAAIVRWGGAEYHSAAGGAPRHATLGYDKREAFEAQLNEFVGVARGTATSTVTRHDALASVRFVAAGYEALRSRRHVRLDEAE